MSKEHGCGWDMSLYPTLGVKPEESLGHKLQAIFLHFAGAELHFHGALKEL